MRIPSESSALLRLLRETCPAMFGSELTDVVDEVTNGVSRLDLDTCRSIDNLDNFVHASHVDVVAPDQMSMFVQCRPSSTLSSGSL